MSTTTPTKATTTSSELIFEVATGFMAAKYLFVATNIGIFEAADESGATLDELAERTGVSRRTVRIVADAAAVLGFLEVDDGSGIYRNAPAAEAFLSGRGPGDLRSICRLFDRLSYPAWRRLEEAALTGGGVVPTYSPEEQAIYSPGVEAFTRPTAAALATVYDFARHRRLLDVGGGTGSFLIPALGAAPDLSATLLELPEVVELARERLSDAGLASRVDVVAGDAFGALPAGHDVVLVANLLHLFDGDRAAALVAHLRGAVEVGGRLLLVDFWTDAGHRSPATAALMAGEFLVHAGGDVFSVDEGQGWLEASGWSVVAHEPLDSPISLLIAEAR